MKRLLASQLSERFITTPAALRRIFRCRSRADGTFLDTCCKFGPAYARGQAGLVVCNDVNVQLRLQEAQNVLGVAGYRWVMRHGSGPRAIV